MAGMGVITRQRLGTAKGFVFLTLEDETGVSNVIIRPDVYARDKAIVVESPFLLVEGWLQVQDGVTAIKAERLQRLDGLLALMAVESRFPLGAGDWVLGARVGQERLQERRRDDATPSENTSFGSATSARPSPQPPAQVFFPVSSCTARYPVVDRGIRVGIGRSARIGDGDLPERLPRDRAGLFAAFEPERIGERAVR